MEVHSKGGSYYGYGKKSAYDKNGGKNGKRIELVGGNISFAAAEAYKLLRTKLQFSFADEGDCRVIGISSALSGEGKSLTAVNLAYTLSQLDKKVLLVDCDMRRPTLAEKLGLLKQPGLSSYLTRQSYLNDLIQVCTLKENKKAFHVISAGQTPPNPIELLSSERMKKALVAMREAYDYVILDLPPVGEVSDAMAVTKQTDGILLVVRQNYCNRSVLAEAVRQFDFINTKTLGVVFNCTSEHSGKYGKGYYKRYYKRYYKGYRSYGYAHAAQNAANNEQA
jgi:capsular exopolysaccharide synthesis family protein